MNLFAIAQMILMSYDGSGGHTNMHKKHYKSFHHISRVMDHFCYGAPNVGVQNLQRNSMEALTDSILNGLRQILKLKTTFGQMQKGQLRTNTNEMVYKLANATINSWEARNKGNGFFRKT